MIPIGDSPRISVTPWVNYALILVNVLVFFRVMGLSTQLPDSRITQRQEAIEQANSICYGFNAAPTEADRFYCRWGFQPKEFFETARGESQAQEPNTRGVLLSILTSMFLHAGFLHIAGNMLFLFVFGDNIEDRLGHIRYLLFYLAGGIVATLIQGFIDLESVVPVVGASGAVAAVLGAYLVFFPKAKVKVIVPFFPLFLFPLRIPALIMIGLWFAQNLVAGLATIGNAASPSGGMAWFAHVGGFAFGAMLTLFIFRPLLRRPPEWRDR